MTAPDPTVAEVTAILRDVLAPAADALATHYGDATVARVVWRWLTADAARKTVDAVEARHARQPTQDGPAEGGRSDSDGGRAATVSGDLTATATVAFDGDGAVTATFIDDEGSSCG